MLKLAQQNQNHTTDLNGKSLNELSGMKYSNQANKEKNIKISFLEKHENNSTDKNLNNKEVEIKTLNDKSK